MKILKVKNILFSLLAIAAVAVFMASCEQEAITVVDEIQEVNNLEASQTPKIHLILSDYSGEMNEEELRAFIKKASEDDILNYRKNYAIANFFMDKGVITETNYETWQNQALYQLNLSDYLEVEDVALVNTAISKIESENMEERANCRWYNYVIGQICHPVFGYCWNLYDSQYRCTTNTVVLYEGNDITQRLRGVIDVHFNRDINFTNNSCCPNDEARSAELWHMKAGQQIALYDDSNPNCNGICEDSRDDWIIITVKKNFSQYAIDSFEPNPRNSGVFINDSFIRAEYGNGGNLDGKVSRFRSRN